MTTNYNSTLTKEIIEVGRLQQQKDSIPSEFSDKILYVADVNPKHARILNLCGNASKSTTAATTIFTTSSTKDTYLTGIGISWTSDATCDSTQYYVDCVLDGQSSVTVLMLLLKQPLTAGNGVQYIEFAYPIKLAKGTTVRHGTTFTVGTTTMNMSFRGFTVDNITA